MNQADYDYLASGLEDAFSEFWSMKYIPLKSREVNRYGEVEKEFDEANSFVIYGVLVSDVNKDKELDRGDSQATNRIEGIIKLVTRQFISKGVVLSIGDAIDVLNEYDKYDRYIITGYDKKVETPRLVTRVLVVKEDGLVSE